MRSNRHRLAALPTWLKPTLFVVAVAIYAQLRTPMGAPATVPEAESRQVRVVTWNLRRLGDPTATHDEARIRQQLSALRPALIAVQEVYSEAALRRTAPAGRVRLSRHGGHGEQRLGFWWDPAQLHARGPAVELERVSLGGHLRPALAQRFAVTHGPNTDLQFWAITVHLKARPSGLPLRKQQWQILRTWLNTLNPHGPVGPPTPMLLLGDFNATGDQEIGSPTQTPAQERDALARALSAAQFRQVRSPRGCSAFWEGPIRDRILEPSLLDLMWVRGPLTIQARGPSAHCLSHSCQSFRSSPAYPDLDYEGISDHCPVVADFEKIDTLRGHK